MGKDEASKADPRGVTLAHSCRTGNDKRPTGKLSLRPIGLLVLALQLLALPVARAETDANTQLEVDFLLRDLAASGCEFYRNGTWHEAHAAEAHLRKKYAYLAASNALRTTDDFIEKAGSESSFSGTAYQVRCNGGATETSRKWLNDELARFRSRR
jgi:hypothetical protein